MQSYFVPRFQQSRHDPGICLHHAARHVEAALRAELLQEAGKIPDTAARAEPALLQFAERLYRFAAIGPHEGGLDIHVHRKHHRRPSALRPLIRGQELQILFHRLSLSRMSSG